MVVKAEVIGAKGTSGRVEGEVFKTSYTLYDRQGNVREVEYLSGLTVSYNYGEGGVLRWIGVNGAPVFDRMVTSASGDTEFMKISDTEGKSVNWARSYNARLWPERIMVGNGIDEGTPADAASVLFSLDYAGGYDRAGNIMGIMRHFRTSEGGQLKSMDFTYTYDVLNRLKTCTFNSSDLNGSYTYTMDLYGNITGRAKESGFPGCAPGTLNLAVDTSTNRLSGKPYDVIGNLKRVKKDDSQLYLNYMDQGHIVKVKDSSNNILYRYYYDSSGQRRIKTAGSSGITGNASYYFYEGNDIVCQQDRGAMIRPDSLFCTSIKYGILFDEVRISYFVFGFK